MTRNSDIAPSADEVVSHVKSCLDERGDQVFWSEDVTKTKHRRPMDNSLTILLYPCPHGPGRRIFTSMFAVKHLQGLQLAN